MQLFGQSLYDSGNMNYNMIENSNLELLSHDFNQVVNILNLYGLMLVRNHYKTIEVIIAMLWAIIYCRKFNSILPKYEKFDIHNLAEIPLNAGYLFE